MREKHCWSSAFDRFGADVRARVSVVGGVEGTE